MRTSLLFLGMVTLLTAHGASSYEWKSHYDMAANARDIFLGKSEFHQPPVGVDPELAKFLSSYGLDLDTRAGDKYKNAFTDEDRNEGYLAGSLRCRYRERDCNTDAGAISRKLGSTPCSFDHFFEKLWIPLIRNEEATVHARRYFDMTVRLYKAGKCSTNAGFAREYKRGTARALGHAIHLVEDMGSPQHTKPENHVFFRVFSGGHGRSFHDVWMAFAFATLPPQVAYSPHESAWRLAGCARAATKAATVACPPPVW